jgi:hypothetical protein
MENLKHTPGPWFPINYAGFWDIQTKDEYSETSVLQDDHYNNAEVNAKLCAAAPELLKVLQDVVEDWKNGPRCPYSIFEAAQAAIKKATE